MKTNIARVCQIGTTNYVDYKGERLTVEEYNLKYKRNIRIPKDVKVCEPAENINEWVNTDYGDESYFGRYTQNKQGEVFFEKDGVVRQTEWYKDEKGKNIKFKPKNFKSLLKQVIKEDDMVFMEEHGSRAKKEGVAGGKFIDTDRPTYHGDDIGVPQLRRVEDEPKRYDKHGSKTQWEADVRKKLYGEVDEIKEVSRQIERGPSRGFQLGLLIGVAISSTMFAFASLIIHSLHH